VWGDANDWDDGRDYAWDDQPEGGTTGEVVGGRGDVTRWRWFVVLLVVTCVLLVVLVR
jgi:hypothetical protein